MTLAEQIRPRRVQQAKMRPWSDRTGRFSPYKACGLALGLLPFGVIGLEAISDRLGSRPVMEAIHQSGDYAVWLLMLSLSVTPLRRIGLWPKLVLARRNLGVAVFCLIALHFSLYITDQKLGLVHVASEIILRFYLTIGFVAFLGLAALAATSTDNMIKRLGAQNWNRLHRCVYAISILGLWHYLLQSKLDVTAAALMSGFFILLMGHRLLHRFFPGEKPLALAGLAIVSGLLTALGEASWYALKSGIAAQRLLESNLEFDYQIRPSWWVMAMGLALLLIRLLRPREDGRARLKRA